MKARYVIGTTAGWLPVTRWCRALSGEGDAFTNVLCYHDVPPSTLQSFDSQIRQLKARYDFIDPRNPSSGWAKGSTRILLTFDDGFKSNKVVAEKVLKPLGIKAVFFVLSAALNLTDPLQQSAFISQNIYPARHPTAVPKSLSFMSREELLELLREGHVIGSHSHSHCKLSEVRDQQELRDEIVDSRSRLEDMLQTPIEWFAYPFGNVSAINTTALAIARITYRYCCSCVRGGNRELDGRSCIVREAVEPDAPAGYARFLAQGGLGVLYRRQRHVLNTMWNESGALVRPEQPR